MAIVFKEHHIIGYKARTLENAKADVTIAIAKDFNTAGEICTRNCVTQHSKTYIQHKYDYFLSPSHTQVLEARMCDHIHHRQSLGFNHIGSLNIAGNGIYTLQESQATIDEYLLTLFTGLFHYLQCKPMYIYSGGQTGIDEAGLKAVIKLDIPAICIAPKGWLFRDINGNDTADEKLFKARFENLT